jgi:hypothetical protein
VSLLTTALSCLGDGGVGEVAGEVAGVGTQPRHRPGPSGLVPTDTGQVGDHRAGDRAERAAQHPGGEGPDIVVAGQQVRGHGQARLGPGRQVRTAGALAGIL